MKDINMKININTLIKVTLTKEGAEALNRYNQQCIHEVLEMCPKADVNFLKTDYVEGDVIEDSLWHLFARLGDYLRANTSAPFKNNEILLER